MNSKSRNNRAPCSVSTLGNLSNNKFIKDYYKLVKPYLHDDFSDIFSKTPSVEDLQSLAESEFFNYYGTFPTCAVFAPGCLSVAGKSTGLPESKSLSMAIQLVTLIVGKRSHGTKWCRVKTITDEIAGEKSFKFHLKNVENLHASMEEESWIRYLKATIQCFKAKRAHVPGFEIIIVSSVPVKRGLGSSSALVVAFYTFLEAITNMRTGNILEKTLACHMAEKLAVESHDLRIADVLTTVVADEDKIFSFDARSLNIDVHDWNSIEVELIFIECANHDVEKSKRSRFDITRHKEILTIMNTAARWRTHPDSTLMLECLFPQETINMTNSIIDEDERASNMVDTIRTEQWDMLGKLLWENYHSARKCFNSLPDNIERIMTVLESTKEILGANVIIGHGHSTSIVALVRRSRFRSFISLLNRMKVSQRYYRIKSFVGASILYTYEHSFIHWNGTEHSHHCPKFLTKYHLRDEDSFELNEYNNFEPTKAISLFIPQGSLFD